MFEVGERYRYHMGTDILKCVWVGKDESVLISEHDERVYRIRHVSKDRYVRHTEPRKFYIVVDEYDVVHGAHYSRTSAKHMMERYFIRGKIVEAIENVET